MSQFAVLYLGLHCLPSYPKYTKGLSIRESPAQFEDPQGALRVVLCTKKLHFVSRKKA